MTRFLTKFEGVKVAVKESAFLFIQQRGWQLELPLFLSKKKNAA